MKKLLTSLIFIFVSLTLFAQTDGISYQAVIIGPDKQELPGVDAEGNIFPDAAIAIRFTILDESNSVEYQEVQTTNTDAFGRINLLIGSVNPDEFTRISWDGSNKDLKVEIDFSGAGSNFLDMSREQLTFVPYAYHRNITAAGTLKVDDATELNSELLVKGPTQLESILAVTGNTDLNSDLLVLGATSLNDSLNLNKGKAANLSGNLTVLGTSDLKGDTKLERIDVAGTSMLNGQVTLDVNMNNNDKDDYNAYPLLVQGSQQGIAIKITGILNQEDNPPGRFNKVPLSTSNNFISFWDATENRMWGRIEGQSIADLKDDRDYQLERNNKIFGVVTEATDFSIWVAENIMAVYDATLSFTAFSPCVGAGACVASPAPSTVIGKIAWVAVKIGSVVIQGLDLVQATKEEINFVNRSKVNIGVSYQSGAADYAEWLPKENPSDVFSAGEIVGINNGMVTKKTWGAEKVMIVSTNPIVLGNMPQPEHENNSVRIAFMGQVPVNVIGKVEPGDYILSNELGIGFARAVNPENMKTRDYKKVAGVAWNVIEEIRAGLSMVNVAVGINTNDLSGVVANQEEELKALQEVFNQLQAQISESNTLLASLVPGYEEAMGASKNTRVSPVVITNEVTDKKSVENNIVDSVEDDIIYFEISKEQIDFAFTMAQEIYQEMFTDQQQLSKLLLNENIKSNPFSTGEKTTNGQNILKLIPLKDHPFWQKINNDPAYKEELTNYIQTVMEKAFHTHKKFVHNFTNLKVRE